MYSGHIIEAVVEFGRALISSIIALTRRCLVDAQLLQTEIGDENEDEDEDEDEDFDDEVEAFEEI